VLDSPDFAAQLREWLKTLRKKNASVVFATQSLADIETSNIAPAIIESCPTRIFLPNERAAEPQIAAIYERFGLNDRQIEILAGRRPSATITASRGAATGCSSWGWARSRWPSPPLLRRPTSSASPSSSRPTAASGFAAEWLRHRGLAWAIDLLPEPQLIRMEPGRCRPAKE
jgi:type IV secretion system protein VirB4